MISVWNKVKELVKHASTYDNSEIFKETLFL